MGTFNIEQIWFNDYSLWFSYLHNSPSQCWSRHSSCHGWRRGGRTMSQMSKWGQWTVSWRSIAAHWDTNRTVSVDISEMKQNRFMNIQVDIWRKICTRLTIMYTRSHIARCLYIFSVLSPCNNKRTNRKLINKVCTNTTSM